MIRSTTESQADPDVAADFVLHDADLLQTADSDTDTRVCLCYPTYTSYLLFLRNKQLYYFIQSFKDPEIYFHLETWAAVDSQVVAYVSILKRKKAVIYISYLMSNQRDRTNAQMSTWVRM